MEPETETLETDPTMTRQQQLQTQLQQTHQRINELSMQQNQISNMIRGLEIQAAELRGALAESLRCTGECDDGMG